MHDTQAEPRRECRDRQQDEADEQIREHGSRRLRAAGVGRRGRSIASEGAQPHDEDHDDDDLAEHQRRHGLDPPAGPRPRLIPCRSCEGDGREHGDEQDSGLAEK